MPRILGLAASRRGDQALPVVARTLKLFGILTAMAFGIVGTLFALALTNVMTKIFFQWLWGTRG